MASHVVGYPCIGPKRELPSALKSFWDEKSSAADLQTVAKDLRASIWKQMVEAGLKFIPSNTFSYYDRVLDTTAMLGAVPPRYDFDGGEIGFDVYFRMAHGNATLPAMEMTKWFDTNYHYIVPELSPELSFSYSSHKAVDEYKEAKALGIDTVPVLVGPMSYLLLSKPARGVAKTFDLLLLLDKILPVYKAVLSELEAAGATWIQLDEPSLVMDLHPAHLKAFVTAYNSLEVATSSAKLLVETYFADIPAYTYKVITSVKGISGFGFDFVRGTQTIKLINRVGFPSDKFLFAGVVDGRNVWANDLAASVKVLEDLQNIVGKEKLVVSSSCSLMHTAVDLDNETKLDAEIKSWLAFAAQKLCEVVALAKALKGHKDVDLVNEFKLDAGINYFWPFSLRTFHEGVGLAKRLGGSEDEVEYFEVHKDKFQDIFTVNAAAQASRRSSPRVTNEAVQKDVAALKTCDHSRATPAKIRLEQQQKKMNLPLFSTTIIGSSPQTVEFLRIQEEYKSKKISEQQYETDIMAEIEKNVKLQEGLDIDVLVPGEFDRNDCFEYLGERHQGFAVTENGWVQSNGSYCVKPPIIYGDVSRPNTMTVRWSKVAQGMTKRPMKGMLTGPVTILNRSFVRNDQPRSETCIQIALAIKEEVEDLEAGDIPVIQIDEAALGEGLPLRKAEHAFYLDWAVRCFRITNCGVKDITQIHSHVCYSSFSDIMPFIINMDADVITIENLRSDEQLLSVLREGVKYGAGIGPGVYDIHSPHIPSIEEITDRISKMLPNILWINPASGLKTRKPTEVIAALEPMVSAAKLLRTKLATDKGA